MPAPVSLRAPRPTAPRSASPSSCPAAALPSRRRRAPGHGCIRRRLLRERQHDRHRHQSGDAGVVFHLPERRRRLLGCVSPATRWEAANIESGYGATQFAGDAATLLTSSFFDRHDDTNPFRNDSFTSCRTARVTCTPRSKPDANYGGRITHTSATRHDGVPHPPGADVLEREPRDPVGVERGRFRCARNWWQTQQAFGTVGWI